VKGPWKVKKASKVAVEKLLKMPCKKVIKKNRIYSTVPVLVRL
jgi:hypothetical protein